MNMSCVAMTKTAIIKTNNGRYSVNWEGDVPRNTLIEAGIKFGASLSSIISIEIEGEGYTDIVDFRFERVE